MTAEFKLLKWQEKVEKARLKGATHIWIKAGRKTGKTEYIRHVLQETCKTPARVSDQINAYIAPARNQAKNILWRRLKAMNRELIDGRPRETELAIDYRNGVRLQLFGADNEDGVRGLTFGPSILDEADYMRVGFYEEVVEPNMVVLKAPTILCSTPRNSWFTKQWRMAKDGLLGKTHAAFHFTIYDNPHIPRDFIERIRRASTKEVWEQEYMANETAYSGLQYSEFTNDHIIGHREPEADGMGLDVKFARALDWGFDHPTHIIWAELSLNKDTGRWRIYVYREMSLRGKCVEDLVAPILAADSRPFTLSVVDIAARRREMGTGDSIANEFRRCGLPLRLAVKNEAYNVNALKMFLKRGDFAVSDRCPILIRQLREVEWGQTVNDDAVDALKYLAGMCYGRDFTNIEPLLSQGLPQEIQRIDPTGILAAEQQEEAFSW